MMKVYLRKDVAKVGMAGDIVKVSDGFAMNYLIPKKLGIQMNVENEKFYQQRAQTVEHRKEVIATETSLLAEKIKAIKLLLKRKMHNDGKLYGSISQAEVADLLGQKGIRVAKNQVLFDKSIKEKGTYNVTIKLSSRLQPKLTLTIVPEI
jgi:large subunit ribosomal protein L9